MKADPDNEVFFEKLCTDGLMIAHGLRWDETRGRGRTWTRRGLWKVCRGLQNRKTEVTALIRALESDEIRPDFVKVANIALQSPEPMSLLRRRPPPNSGCETTKPPCVESMCNLPVKDGDREWGGLERRYSSWERGLLSTWERWSLMKCFERGS